jgi:predicted RNA-binding Zn-ribbon protein involved in translation (DUF1610 family)
MSGLAISSLSIGLLLCVIFPFSTCGYKIARAYQCEELSSAYDTESYCF